MRRKRPLGKSSTVQFFFFVCFFFFLIGVATAIIGERSHMGQIFQVPIL